MLLPRAAGWLIAVVIPTLALAALVTGGLAIFRRGERSGLLKALLALLLVGVLFFVVGEVFFPH